MATTLSKGYKKPSTGELGSDFYPALEHNIERQNAHRHDGLDGERIRLYDLEKTVTELGQSSWEPDASDPGTWIAELHPPASALENGLVVTFLLAEGPNKGCQVPLEYSVIDGVLTVRTNDPTEIYQVIYG